jgi:hypothetical protein
VGGGVGRAKRCASLAGLPPTVGVGGHSQRIKVCVYVYVYVCVCLCV